ncbi:hypothetical protein JHD48_04000 [Sulfurimonas sp. SAG-AH-194-I05]|nr:CheR family methyltransferase [Sulfurimonas sp. SAG-AH-194-I05]MDF1874890.1 hypothetical protein [Sulfurimonas sp. SAG-AH-194-I05]
MIRSFNAGGTCHLMLQDPIKKDDITFLKNALNKHYDSWHVEFGNSYTVTVAIIDLLYYEIFENEKDISLTLYRSKLNRYFQSLGFKTKFVSLLKNEVVDFSEVEVILLGGSAGSSEKIIKMVSDICLEKTTLVLVQHVQADTIGIFDSVLQKYTKYKVSYAKDGEKLLQKHIYIAPRSKHLAIVNNCFHLNDAPQYNFAKPSISLSYESFSSFYKEKLLIIHSCGYSNDGVDTLEHVRHNNSKLIIQEPSECKAKSMIEEACTMQLHNYILKEKEIILLLNIINKNMTKEAWCRYLFEHIRNTFEFDFSHYHEDMLQRRTEIFMIKHSIKHIQNAIAVIMFNASALKIFFLEISINVTELFRNPTSFKHMHTFLEKKYTKQHHVKLWSAGCSSGEEVYSIAILLDSLGLFEKSIYYATDFNEVVLEEAKNGMYANNACIQAQKNFEKLDINFPLDKYFIKNSNYVKISENIKNKILFFKHNLTHDSSFNEFDIIMCKNVIIYFNYDLQLIVFQLFYDSLTFGGHLVLGESEMILPAFKNKFKQYAPNSKIFIKVT